MIIVGHIFFSLVFMNFQEDDDSAASQFGTDECPEAVEKALSNKIQVSLFIR